MVGKLLARWRARQAFLNSIPREFVKAYGSVQMTDHWSADAGSLGFTVDRADERIAVAPDFLDQIPRDDDGLLVFAALNGTWRYRINGEVRLRHGPTIVLAELVSTSRVEA